MNKMLFLDQVCSACCVPDEALVNGNCSRAQSTFSDLRTLMRRQHANYQITPAANHMLGKLLSSLSRLGH